MPALFTYGTLMFEPVWRRVTGGTDSAGTPAVVDGFARFRVRGETYPAMIRAPGQQVSGVIYTGLTDDQLATLDTFEGEEYQRIGVATQSGSAAFAYLCCVPNIIDAVAWVPEQFEANDMAAFIQDYCGSS